MSMEEFSSKIGLTKGNISNFENHKYEPSFKAIVEICKQFEVDSNWLLTGIGSPYIKGEKPLPEQEAHAPPPASDVIELRHMELVRGFSDKQRAYEINRELMELEKLDRDAFMRIECYIKGTVDQVRFAAEREPYYGRDRRIDERRNGEGNSDLPEGGNRRTGKDRSKLASK